MKDHKISKRQRIQIVMKYLYLRGGNKESVNNVYRKYCCVPAEDQMLYNEDKSDRRMNIIGRNGNTGEHYV